jgi:hypothetical protein
MIAGCVPACAFSAVESAHAGTQSAIMNRKCQASCLVCRPAAGQTAALIVPVGYFLAMATGGKRRDGSHQVWAFPAHEAGLRTVGTALALALLALGFLAFAVRKRRPAQGSPRDAGHQPARPADPARPGSSG